MKTGIYAAPAVIGLTIRRTLTDLASVMIHGHAKDFCVSDTQILKVLLLLLSEVRLLRKWTIYKFY